MILAILAGASVSAAAICIASPIAYLLEKSTDCKPKRRKRNRKI